jgi:hypothetical protein
MPVLTGTQRTLATHRLPKSHEHRAPQWPRHLVTGPSLALATTLASSSPSTCRQHRALCQLKQPSKHQKTHFFTPQPCLLGMVLLPTGVHTCTPVHYTGAHPCAPVCFTGAPLCAPVHHTSALRCVHVQLTGAPFERALKPLYRAPMHVYPVGKHARMCAYHRITRACGAHIL